MKLEKEAKIDDIVIIQVYTAMCKIINEDKRIINTALGVSCPAPTLPTPSQPREVGSLWVFDV